MKKEDPQLENKQEVGTQRLPKQISEISVNPTNLYRSYMLIAETRKGLISLLQVLTPLRMVAGPVGGRWGWGITVMAGSTIQSANRRVQKL